MRKILFTFFFIIVSNDLLSLTNDERQIINTFNNYVTQGWYEKIDNDERIDFLDLCINTLSHYKANYAPDQRYQSYYDGVFEDRFKRIKQYSNDEEDVLGKILGECKFIKMNINFHELKTPDFFEIASKEASDILKIKNYPIETVFLLVDYYCFKAGEKGDFKLSKLYFDLFIDLNEDYFSKLNKKNIDGVNHYYYNANLVNPLKIYFYRERFLNKYKFMTQGECGHKIDIKKAFKYLERLNNKFDDTKIKFAYKYQTLFRDKNKNDRKRIAEELVELAAQDSEIHYFLGHYYLFGKNLFNFLTPFNYQVRDYKKAKFHLEKYINREFRYYEFTVYENLALRELGEIYFGVFDEDDIDYEKSIKYLTLACEGGSLPTCHRLANIYKKEKYNNQNELLANKYMLWAVIGGNNNAFIQLTGDVIGLNRVRGVPIKANDRFDLDEVFSDELFEEIQNDNKFMEYFGFTAENFQDEVDDEEINSDLEEPFQFNASVAIIINNSNYKDDKIDTLSQTRTDALMMEEELTARGFLPFRMEDVPTKDLLKLIDMLEKVDISSKANFDLVIYYSGHAISYKGKNYIIPVDIKLPLKPQEIDKKLIDVQRIIDIANRKKGNNIFIFDSCRSVGSGNNSGQDVMEFRTKNGLLLSSGLESGLSPLKIRENNYIVYAAGVNQAAMIKKDEIMSVFTKALYDEMNLDGNFEKSLEELIKSTRKKVISVTEGQQLPWTASSLSEDYHLYSDFTYNIRYYIQRKILASRKNKKN